MCEFISPSFSLKIFAHENSQFSQLKRLGKHCAVSALSRRFLCAKLVFKYLVVMTSNYASSGPSQTERLREREREQSRRAINRGWNWRRRCGRTLDEEICLVDTGQQNTCSARPLCFVGYFKRGSISKYWSILNMGINIVRTELKLSSFGQSNWLSTCDTMRCDAMRCDTIRLTASDQSCTKCPCSMLN